MSDYGLIIDGKKVYPEETFGVINPATEEVLAECPKAGQDHLDQAVAAARRAFGSWSLVADSERSRLLHAVGRSPLWPRRSCSPCPRPRWRPVCRPRSASRSPI